MREFEALYLSWRKGAGNARFLVGKIDLPQVGPATFAYIISEVEKARKEGFSPYTEFQNIEGKYSQNVLDIFGQRLNKSVRPDIQAYYDFWEIDPAKTGDKAYMLAHTQGLLPTDNFEFLADYNPTPTLRFLTDLAYTSQQAMAANSLLKGDALSIEFDANNEHDNNAVIALKDGRRVGYIKRVHCHLFHKPGAEHIRITVKAVEQNGIIKRVFAKVSNSSS